MTDVLRETLEERGRATAWTDVDGLVAAGDRRVRRRRLSAGAATLAVLAAVGVAVPYVVSGLDAGADQGQVAVDDPDAAPVSWSTGSVVHVGDREVDLGTTPFAYVLTDAGVVWADAESGVWFTDLDGGGEQVGTLGAEARRLLVADGPLAAWYDGDAAGFVVLDTVTGEVVREVSSPIDAQQRQGFGGGPEVRAINDGVLWFAVGGRSTGIDVATGETVGAVRARGEEGGPADVRAGLLAITGSDGTTTVTEPSGEEVGAVPGDDRVVLSPDATFVITTSQDVTSVWDVATGEDVTPDHGYDFFFAVRWLDDDTYEALGLADLEDPSGNDAPAGDVITCSVDDGGCEVVAEGAFSPSAPFSVPIGESTSD